jgi:hypothetical protein
MTTVAEDVAVAAMTKVMVVVAGTLTEDTAEAVTTIVVDTAVAVTMIVVDVTMTGGTKDHIYSCNGVLKSICSTVFALCSLAAFKFLSFLLYLRYWLKRIHWADE